MEFLCKGKEMNTLASVQMYGQHKFDVARLPHLCANRVISVIPKFNGTVRTGKEKKKAPCSLVSSEEPLRRTESGCLPQVRAFQVHTKIKGIQEKRPQN